MGIRLLKKLRDIGVPVLVFFIAGVLFLLAAKALAKKPEQAIEKELEVGKGYEIAELFPDEKTREGQMIGECGAFVDYLDRSYAEADTDAILSTLNETAFIKRTGRNMDKERIADTMLKLRESYPDSRLKMKYAVIKDPASESSPDAVIIAELVKKKAGCEEEYLNDSAYPVNIYAYFDGNGHIAACLFAEMETKRH